MNKLNKIIFFSVFVLQSLFLQTVSAEEKIKIGLLVPMTGSNKNIGEVINIGFGKPIKIKSLILKTLIFTLIKTCYDLNSS